MHPGISVLTVTRRCHALERCVESVARQDYAGAVEHVIVTDDQPWVHPPLGQLTSCATRTIISVPREPGEVDGPARLATLRNRSVTFAGRELVVFLDDDNTWDPSHLSSLQSLMVTTRADLVHSERLLLTSDGQAYLCPEYPWARDPEERRKIYEEYVRVGVMARGSHRLRDRMDMAHSCVDLGEWLFPRPFLMAHPFESAYSVRDWEQIIVEDAKLSRNIATSGARIFSTGRPTLNYFLGGYSNNFSENASIYWHRGSAASHD